MEKRVYFMIGRSSYYTYSKPNSETTATIIRNIFDDEYDAYEIKKSILNGYTLRPAIFDGETFISQQLFFVDVDNNDTVRTIDNNLQICKKLGLIPMMIYGTFNFNSKNQKHRLVFATEQPVNNLYERNLIVEKLNEIFKGDKITENMKRAFYPGKVVFFFNPFQNINNNKLLEVINNVNI